MRQALHIFKKDARHLRWEIALVLLLTAAFAYVDAHPIANTGPGAVWDSYQWWDQILKLLLLLAWFLLIERVIHSEALPGNKQFWLTRPYSWKSLLAAKTLVLLAFITLPMMIADSAIVTRQGFSVAAHLPGLLWLQALRFVVIVVPIAGLAAITEGLTGMVFWAVVIIVAFAGFSAVNPVIPPDWIRDSIDGGFGTAAVIAIVIWQYARRQTLPARMVFGCVLAVGSLFPWIPGSAVFRLDAVPSLTIGLDSSSRPIVQRSPVDMVNIELPLRFAGVPEGLTAGIDASRAHIESPDLGTIVSGPTKEWSRLLIRMNGKSFERVKNEPIRIRLSLYVTLFGNPKTFPLPPETGSIPIPKVGLCDTDLPDPYIYRCWSPFRRPAVRVLVNGNRGIQTPAYSPYPAEFGISPMTSFANFHQRVPAEPPSITLTTEEPMAHLRRDLTFNIRLADFYNE